MKKSIKPKIKKIEAIYDSKIITETSEIFLNFLKILKKETIITDDNFLYFLEQLNIFEYDLSRFNYLFFGTKNPNITNISINQRYINENITRAYIFSCRICTYILRSSSTCSSNASIYGNIRILCI